MTIKPRWLALAPDLSPLRGSPGFRSLYLARSVSLLSIAILAVTVAWQVYELSGSSLHVAGVSVGLALGSLVGLLWGGTWADRSDRRRIMIGGRAAYVGVVLLLWGNSVQTEPDLIIIYLATLLSGLTSGISAPALMAALPRLVPPHQLAAAGALNALALELGRLLGPLIAGLLLARTGPAFSYGLALAGAVVVPLLLALIPKDALLPPASQPSPPARPSLVKQWLEGFRYIRHHKVIACLLAIDLVAMLFVSIHVLIPQLGENVLAKGPEMVGYLYAAPAVGALLVAATSGWTRALSRPGRLIILATMIWGMAVLLAGVAASRVSGDPEWISWFVLGCFVVTGMADTATDIVRGAVLQQHTPDALRGRVSALWLLQGYIGPALGGLQIAGLAALWSPARALITGGGLCAGLIGAALAWPASGFRGTFWRLGAAQDDRHP